MTGGLADTVMRHGHEPLAASTAAAGASSLFVFPQEAAEAYFQLRWGVACIILLIIADFYLGLTESVRVKKERFRFSRAGRRTMGKFIEYMFYIAIGATLGKSILEPLGVCSYIATAALGVAFAACWELDSILSHVAAIHGVTWNFSVKRFVVALIKAKSKDAGAAVEAATEEGKE